MKQRMRVWHRFARFKYYQWRVRTDRTPRAVRLLTFAYAALLLLASLMFAWFIIRPFLWQPIREFSPQQVLEPRGADGLPIVKLSSGVVTVRATKCNYNAEPVEVSGASQWIRAEDNTLTYLQGTQGGSIRKPGCVTVTFRNVLPVGISAGVWKITGVGTAHPHVWWLAGVEQTETWETEQFRVVNE